mmetsp:Transcript_23367/g.80341  ORF Transcript_23367/g.80341 Transcript_23367/m.80341 type:complete len:279 (+) Transcript_23367:1881-2717(+)
MPGPAASRSEASSRRSAVASSARSTEIASRISFAVAPSPEAWPSSSGYRHASTRSATRCDEPPARKRDRRTPKQKGRERRKRWSVATTSSARGAGRSMRPGSAAGAAAENRDLLIEFDVSMQQTIISLMSRADVDAAADVAVSPSFFASSWGSKLQLPECGRNICRPLPHATVPRKTAGRRSSSTQRRGASKAFFWRQSGGSVTSFSADRFRTKAGFDTSQTEASQPRAATAPSKAGASQLTRWIRETSEPKRARRRVSGGARGSAAASVTSSNVPSS